MNNLIAITIAEILPKISDLMLNKGHVKDPRHSVLIRFDAADKVAVLV